MLEIGLNENWKLGPNSKVSDKGGLELNYIKGVAITSALELMNAEDAEQEESFILLFPPKVVDYKTKAPRTSIEVARDLRAEYKKVYMHFALYFTKAELQDKFPPSIIYEDTGITKDNESTLMVQESIVSKMFANLANGAIKLIKEEELWDKEEFRIKMLRQSKDKAFPRLTYKPEYDNWIELMSTGKDPVKVKFTSYEISKGYDNAIPTTTDAVKAATPGNDAFAGNGEDALPTTVIKEESTDNSLPFD